ncbi:uncharacterized protein F5Z01DRAFT_436542 [Emericellopsis atlantica]|uniref:Uncharacterized protein n=1 Tax=Emericellopsis atlantica TaxID=2614577 RepID=A0A9P7ZDP1_9HYPO|nr:uncharacterized protein F5Z01DRAFT_436542 [Emericellopsis atlantica]KAG9249877.1 hypothetical protein F5Z01DRAFT_436542 [Emericellopsis atlantica]
MHPTRASRSLKNLFAGYHEPANLSSRQTVKLLDDLKASFRAQLDREHGFPQNTSDPSVGTSAQSSDSLSVTRASAASIHLQQLLQNPIFLQRDRPALKHNVQLGTPQDPMDVFDRAAAKGVLTMKAAKGCLMAKHRQLKASPGYPTNLADTNVGLRALQWLQTLPEYQSPQFTVDIHLLTEIIPYLQAEGRIGVVWQWLSRMIEASSDTSSEQHSGRLGILLTRIVSAQMRMRQDSLDGAIMTLLEADKAFKTHGLARKDFRRYLHHPWRTVSWETTVNAKLDRPEPTPKLYDEHVGIADSFRDRLDVERAHLLLHHPKHPDCEPALRLLGEKGRVEDILCRSIARDGSATMDCVSWLRVLVKDALGYLQECGSAAELDHFKGSLKAVFRYDMSLPGLASVPRKQAVG